MGVCGKWKTSKTPGRIREEALLRDKRIYVTPWLPLLSELEEDPGRAKEEVCGRAASAVILKYASNAFLGNTDEEGNDKTKKQTKNSENDSSPAPLYIYTASVYCRGNEPVFKNGKGRVACYARKKQPQIQIYGFSAG